MKQQDIGIDLGTTSIIIATHDLALMNQFDATRLVLVDGRLHVYE